MKRRAFLLSLLLVGPIAHWSSEASSFSLFSGLLFGARNKQLKINGIYLASPSAFFLLPSDPKDGDSLRIIVDRNSLKLPCQLHSKMATIAGEKTDLALDSLAIVKMTYDSKNLDWKIS
jgi:hypothetical protein